MTPADRTSRLAAPRWLLESEAGARALALIFFVLTLSIALSGRYLHDEACFTIDLARIASKAPVAVFFLEKAKPVLMLVYVIPAAIGYPAFLVMHAAVGAAAVWLVAGAARHLGIPSPNVAALALAASSSFVIAASNGYPNSDGAFFVALFLFLYASERRVAAAVVLGILPFARNELAAITVVFAAWDLATRRDPRFIGAMLALPLAYGVAGAVYHRDVFWLYTEFPNPAGMPHDIRVYRGPSLLEGLAGLRAALLSNAPLLVVFGVAVLARPDRRIAPYLGAMFAAYLGMAALQLADVLLFDTSPRYYVAATPALAVLAAAGLSEDRRERRTWMVAAAIALACGGAGIAAAVASAVVVIAVVLGWRGRRGVAVALLVVGSAGWLAWQLADETIRERTQLASWRALAAEMRARGLWDGGPLFVDYPIARYDQGVRKSEVHLLANAAITWETESYLNPANGQRAVLLGAAEAIGIEFHPEAHRFRHDATYSVRDGERTRSWRDRLEAEGARGVRVGESWVYTFARTSGSPPPESAR